MIWNSPPPKETWPTRELHLTEDEWHWVKEMYYSGNAFKHVAIMSRFTLSPYVHYQVVLKHAGADTQKEQRARPCIS